VVVDDHELFAEALRVSLQLEGMIVHRLEPREIAELMGGTRAAVRRAAANYDLALIDLDLDGLGDGSALISPFAEAGVVVVVVTGSVDRARWGESIQLGAAKVIAKSRPLDEVLAAVRRARQGAPLASDAEREELVRTWYHRKLHEDQLCARLQKLSPRERDVLRQLTLGRTVSEIAAEGHLSPATVRTQVKSILAKLEVSSQIAAVGLANAALRRRA
jgi:DNA-binding NarL/FixJ family response regulator